MSTYTLAQDNAWENITVNATEPEIVAAVRQVLGWRTDHRARLMKAGSSDYDRVIARIARNQEATR